MGVKTGEIVIGRGSLDRDLLPVRPGRTRVAILTQEAAANFARRAQQNLECESSLIVVPDGEEAKSLEVAQDVYLELNRIGLTRADTLLAVGGGAATDLGGFVAATYLRGIEAVYCPTTLLGAVDAAIGGKTGVNVGGKNLVGVFSHPARVVIDVDILDELPQDLRRQGLAESLKAGLIADADLVNLLERDGDAADLEEVVRRAVAVKTAVVAEDFRESGRRAILNYGHTIGHAIEMAAGLSHGEAVAVGMVAAGAVSTRLTGFTEAGRQRAIIERLGLPIAVAFDWDRVRDLIGLDKKRDASGIRMVLLQAIGQPVLRPVDDESIDLALTAIQPSE